MTPCERTAGLPIWLWLFIPTFVLSLVIVAELFLSRDLIATLINHEHGFIENGTFVLLLIAIYFGCLCIKRSKSSLLSHWFLLLTLICVYFAGEEISWGQHYFSWETPEAIKNINDQNETNLHNMSSWFDQKPRIALELSILIGGIIFPLYVKLRKVSYSIEDWKFIVIPTLFILPTAIFAIAIRIPERIDDHFRTALTRVGYEVRFSEIQEFFFAYFFMLYLINCYKRLNIKV